ncbi:unnamed protein product [[Actinomadura] parvosata subsp. kistnae]|uniref:DUF6968 domain-containing protein n=1 Tax=[Actinomadura] parvosata subsp. kistnae TaxID=1909395 RepID=A0A1V0A0C2_9ACTN|nr:hypothetical protein [Nonomuraea sp. ATCC 55076]AQZ63629.1 hypothetical protein BKM31_21135 [Nonomuraea sp. ATCC 55076]SPL99414.1 unnamed protein product [Actinomadura parvosata subsp. kistnae]
MATTDELGETVAERLLEAVAPDGTRTPVTVRLGRPRPDDSSAHGDWCCPCRIVGLGEDIVTVAFGVDSLQALLLGVYKVRLTLEERARAAGVRLEWLERMDLALEVVPVPRDLEATDTPTADGLPAGLPRPPVAPGSA